MSTYGRYHRMIESIAKQEEAISNVSVLLETAPGVVLTGVGKSYGIAQHGASLLQSVGVRATAVHATDMFHGGLTMLTPGCVLVCLSHSGQTMEVGELLVECVERRLTIGITSDVLSTVGVMSDYLLTYACEKDGSRHETIPAVSTAGQLVIINGLACAIADRKTREELSAGHPGGQLYEEEA